MYYVQSLEYMLCKVGECISWHKILKGLWGPKVGPYPWPVGAHCTHAPLLCSLGIHPSHSKVGPPDQILDPLLYSQVVCEPIFSSITFTEAPFSDILTIKLFLSVCFFYLAQGFIVWLAINGISLV